MGKITKGYKVGKAQTLWKCCREIRIQTPKELGVIYEGFNTISQQHEKWMLIKIDKSDHNNNILQQILY